MHSWAIFVRLNFFTKNGYLGRTKHRMNSCQICQIVLVGKENKKRNKQTDPISKQNILTRIQSNFVLNFASVLFKKVKTPTKQSVV